MKKILSNILPLLLLTLVSCGDDGQEASQYTTDNIIVSDRTVIIGATNISAWITVTANCQWTAEVDSGRWEGLTINSVSNRVEIVTTINDKPQVRKARLIVCSQSKDVKRTVYIQQNAGDVTLSLSTQSIQLPASTTSSGSTVQFTVTSNTAWNISGGADWLSFTPNRGDGGDTETVIVKLINDNNEEQEHVATITVTSGTKTKDITVTQIAKTIELVLSLSDFEVAATETNYQINVFCNHTWIVQKDQDWLDVNPDKGENNGTFTVKCKTNDTKEKREATLRVIAGSKKEQVKILQSSTDAPVMGELTVSNVSKTQATVECSFTSKDFEVEEYGICYSTTNEEPTFNDNPIEHSNGGLSGNVSELLTGLTSGQTYFVRAFARNKSGIGYSKAKSFKTDGRKPEKDDNSNPSL